MGNIPCCLEREWFKEKIVWLPTKLFQSFYLYLFIFWPSGGGGGGDLSKNLLWSGGEKGWTIFLLRGGKTGPNNNPSACPFRECSSSTLSLFSPLFIWLCPFFTLLFLYDPFSSSPPFLPSLLLLLLIGPLILSPTYSVSYSVLFSSFLLSFSYLFRLCFLSPPSFSSPFFIYLFLLSVSPSHSLYSFSLPFFFLSPSLLVVSLVRWLFILVPLTSVIWECIDNKTSWQHSWNFWLNI